MYKICTVENCEGAVKQSSYCCKHYQRFRKYGMPTAGGPYRAKSGICSVDNCNKKTYGRGWCALHYQRWFKWGNPTALKVKQGTAIERLKFMTKEVSSGCIEWQGSVDIGGYGRLTDDSGKHQMAHRLSYILELGEIPDNKILHHKCNNPPCVNPKHLRPSTYRENSIDFGLTNLGYLNSKKTHCPKGHEYTGNNTYHRPNSTARYCRACNRLNARVQNKKRYKMLKVLKEEGAIK